MWIKYNRIQGNHSSSRESICSSRQRRFFEIAQDEAHVEHGRDLPVAEAAQGKARVDISGEHLLLPGSLEEG